MKSCLEAKKNQIRRRLVNMLSNVHPVTLSWFPHCSLKQRYVWDQFTLHLVTWSFVCRTNNDNPHGRHGSSFWRGGLVRNGRDPDHAHGPPAPRSVCKEQMQTQDADVRKSVRRLPIITKKRVCVGSVLTCEWTWNSRFWARCISGQIRPDPPSRIAAVRLSTPKLKFKL